MACGNRSATGRWRGCASRGCHSRRAVDSSANFCTLRLTGWRARAVRGASRLGSDRDANHSHPAESFISWFATSPCLLIVSQKDMAARLYGRGAHFGNEFEERHDRGAFPAAASQRDTPVDTHRREQPLPAVRVSRLSPTISLQVSPLRESADRRPHASRSAKHWLLLSPGFLRFSARF